jgi:hypothetical protein
MREAKKNGVKIGLPQGTILTTKKSLDCIAIIKKHSKDFGGRIRRLQQALYLRHKCTSVKFLPCKSEVAFRSELHFQRKLHLPVGQT